MTVSLTDYSGVSPLTKSFTVTVACTVQTLSFTATPPASTTIQIGIDTQPFYILFGTTKTPNCTQPPVFTLTPNFGFIATTTIIDGVSGMISINGATLTNVGSYTMTLTADVDSKTISTSFAILI